VKWNIIGFKKYTDAHYPSCSTCYAVLIKNPKELTQLICPTCGLLYEEEEQLQKIEDEKNKPALTPKVSPIRSRPMIMQARGNTSRSRLRRNKKLYDDLGNEINQKDLDIMNDLAQGRKVLFYKKDIVTKTYVDNAESK
jgi:hypothetical protein